jgi:methane/ammonia monooxygenase subunit B
VGWIYQANQFPTKMPQQVVQFAPPEPAIASAPVFAKASGATATYDKASQTLTMMVNVENTGQKAMELKEFTTTSLRFVPSAPAATDIPMTVTPSTTVEPGASTQMTLALKTPAWETEHLLPIGESQLVVTGILVFDDEDATRNLTEVQANLRPRFE